MATSPEIELDQEQKQVADKPAQPEVVFLEAIKTHMPTMINPKLTASPIRVAMDHPHIIPFNDDEYNQPSQTNQRYNLRSHAKHISQSAITSTNTTISAVIDTKTGDSLEYRQLV